VGERGGGGERQRRKDVLAKVHKKFNQMLHSMEHLTT
jgi:hypothetical protein